MTTIILCEVNGWFKLITCIGIGIPIQIVSLNQPFTSHNVKILSLNSAVTKYLYRYTYTYKVKGKGPATCYSAAYTTLELEKRFTISEAAADWHELMIPQRIMWPFIVLASEQLDPPAVQHADIIIIIIIIITRKPSCR